MAPTNCSEEVPDGARLVPWCGEGRTVWYVVNPSAPGAEQPCVLASITAAAEAERVRRLLEHR